MEKLLASLFTVGIVLVVLLMWLTGNAAWVLLLLNLLWMFFKGGVLFSWWFVVLDVVIFIALLVGFVSIKIWIESK